MARTEISAANIQAMVQDIWSPLFSKELRAKNMLAGLVDKKYEGDIKKLNDTVKVSQINAPLGSLLSVGVDADSFDTESLSSTTIDIKADKRAVAAYEFEDLVMLQSQLGQKDSEIRESLLYSVNTQINNYLYSLVNPSTSAPDHLVTGVTDFNATQLVAVRKLAAQAKWMKDKPWYLLLDPSYYSDVLNSTTLVSGDFVNDKPVANSPASLSRHGFNIMEDDSRSEDYGLAFHPDFLHLAMQTEPTFKVSDQHSNKKFGFIISVDVVFGAKLGIDGDVKHIKITA